jgi:hypothetical protein
MPTVRLEIATTSCVGPESVVIGFHFLLRQTLEQFTISVSVQMRLYILHQFTNYGNSLLRSCVVISPAWPFSLCEIVVETMLLFILLCMAYIILPFQNHNVYYLYFTCQLFLAFDTSSWNVFSSDIFLWGVGKLHAPKLEPLWKVIYWASTIL